MEPLHSIIMYEDETIKHVDIDRASELETLQSLVGGYVDVAPVTDNRFTFWVNEEGKLLGLPVNRRATEFWWHTYPVYAGLDILCGPVALTGGADDKGITKSLPKCFAPIRSSSVSTG